MDKGHPSRSSRTQSDEDPHVRLTTSPGCGTRAVTLVSDNVAGLGETEHEGEAEHEAVSGAGNCEVNAVLFRLFCFDAVGEEPGWVCIGLGFEMYLGLHTTLIFLGF